MANNAIKEINGFNKEYEYFIENYLLQLLGISKGVTVLPYGDNNKTFPNVSFEEDAIIFAAGGTPRFKVNYQRGLSKDSKKLAIELCSAFFQVSEYQYSDQKKNNRLQYSDVKRNALYQMAVQNGICKWLIDDNAAVEQLLDQLETWAVQTYEGKKVTFGFVIDPTDDTPPQICGEDWLEFLKSDFSALLTDSIHSVIQLDKNCGFVRYLSLTDNKTNIKGATLTPDLPLRFTQSISEYVQGSTIGIFLLNNGDIILAKDKSIKFVKRNRHWLNFSFEAFWNSAVLFRSGSKQMKPLLQDIYATMLDVSFAHTGGIIAVVRGADLLRSGEAPVLKPYDDLLQEPKQEVPSKVEEQRNQQANILKRSVIKNLVGSQKFQDLDRKLRSELTAMDGACILDMDGRIISFGAIIRSSEEASGGARSAASKTLSKYGLAVKISTDGYVELYIDGDLKFSIK